MYRHLDNQNIDEAFQLVLGNVVEKKVKLTPTNITIK